MRIRNKKMILGFFIFTLIFDLLGFVNDKYDTIRFYDDVAHFLTSFTFSLIIGINYLSYLDTKLRRSHLITLVTIASLTLMIGVSYEIFEWVSGKYFGFIELIAIDDTIYDLILDMTGALLGSLWITSSSPDIHQPKLKDLPE